MDETWLNQNHTQDHIWQNPENTDGFKVPIEKSSRLIVCHAGSSSFGFVKNSKLVFRYKFGSSEDYHSQMNSAIFLKKCFIEMLTNLEEPCVVVMDYFLPFYVSRRLPESEHTKDRCVRQTYQKPNDNSTDEDENDDNKLLY